MGAASCSLPIVPVTGTASRTPTVTLRPGSTNVKPKEFFLRHCERRRRSSGGSKSRQKPSVQLTIEKGKRSGECSKHKRQPPMHAHSPSSDASNNASADTVEEALPRRFDPRLKRKCLRGE